MFRTQEIQLKSPADILLMREAGLVVGTTLERLRAAVEPGISTGELDAIAEESIRSMGGIPSFKGYHGFPASICASVNDQVVHGIPSKGQVLQDGDLISIDCGAIVDGWHGDSAITVPVGTGRPEDLKMAEVCADAMWAGFAAAKVGGRLTDISYAVEQAVRAGGKYGIVKHYGGHGIGTEMHQDPHVLNYGKPGRGPKLRVGMALAIEPMITMADPDTVELEDGWTVVTVDGSRAAHTEHTFVLTEDGPWVLTALDGGVGRLGDAVTRQQSRA
ncbi:type I methionyl aminopeptidase [Cryptosporangium phraense]|uniref:Methionine aminopeptidase n=1 Tax=Cryptosporangium phraense TaxID=2593070 RepID=A0A545AYG1_9ACTN|nr:type I methionyl aminopeptidase [Cryptosporangium phraense]TQS46370.1 type I methionyl aminopeptidase [Cryptosporangium phraense]